MLIHIVAHGTAGATGIRYKKSFFSEIIDFEVC
jgi:hypothetical protein